MRVTESRRCASVSARRLPASSNASDRYSPHVGEMAGRAVAREPKEIVARGYDAIALRYAEWAGQVDSPVMDWVRDLDRKSTRLNSSHANISYAVFCLKKKKSTTKE